MDDKCKQSKTNLVTNHTNYSATQTVDIEGDLLVIVLSKPGYIALASGSSMPANDYIPDGGIDSIGTEGDAISGTTIVIITSTTDDDIPTCNIPIIPSHAEYSSI